VTYPESSFPGKVALVTGSSRGIGRACLERLADSHDGLVVHYRRTPALAQETATGLRLRNRHVLVCSAELEDEGQVDAMFDAIAARFGRIDTLVANAAAGAIKAVVEQSRRHVERTMGTTIGSFVQMVSRSIPLFPGTGRIVTISGLDSRFFVPLHGMMGAAKAGYEALTRALAVELASSGVTVNSVVPGSVATDSHNKYSKFEAAVLAATPDQRLASAEEVAHAVAFFCSEMAAHITGQSLVIDGGLSAAGGPWGLFANELSTSASK
jgi:NAD(P)-dependent dehydrogenase (short-subunit alcohol dehydrogenase family)